MSRAALGAITFTANHTTAAAAAAAPRPDAAAG